MIANNDPNYEIFSYAAIKIQSIGRRFLARKKIIQEINLSYEKILDPKRRKYYYYNKKKDKSTWQKPRLLYNSDIIRISPTYTDDVAAKLIQSCIRMMLGLLKTRLLYQQIIIITSDSINKTNIYYNPNSQVTMKSLPKFMKNRLNYVRKPPRDKNFWKKLLKTKIKKDDNEEEEEEDEEETDEEEEDENDSAEEDDSSVDSYARKEKRKQNRKYPRSIAQSSVDYAEDHIEQTTSLSLAGLGATRITSRVYELEELIHLDVSQNLLYRISPNIQYLTNLKILDFHKNKLKTLPKELEELKLLEELNISNNLISNYPGCIYKLKNLKKLDLSHNLFTEIPTETGNLELLQELGQWEVNISLLTNLCYLDLSYCQFKIWPLHIEEIIKLQYLDLSYNQLQEIPSMLGIMTTLKTLNLSHNNIDNLCLDFYYLKDIEIVDLSYNQLHDLPQYGSPEVLSMDSLKQLNLSYNKLQYLDDRLGIFHNVITLDISHNEIKDFIGGSLARFIHMTYFDISYNYIKEILPHLGYCTMLTHFECSYNKLIAIPESLFKTTKLIYINLSHNDINETNGKVFSMLNDLIRLELQYNQIESLPISIYTLKKLDYLDVSHNKLTMIQEGLGQLVSIKYLNLSYNHIISLPDTISDLINMKTIELKSNKLMELPKTIHKLYGLSRITISRNELLQSPSLLKELPLLLSSNLSWNLNIQGNYINWNKKMEEYKPKKNYIIIPILKRKIKNAFDKLDQFLINYQNKTRKMLFKIKENPDEMELTSFLADIDNNITNDNNINDSATKANQLAKEQLLAKKLLKLKEKNINKIQSTFKWHQSLKEYLIQYIDKQTNDINNNDNDNHSKINRNEASIEYLKSKKQTRLNAYLISLFKQLDLQRGISYGSLYKNTVLEDIPNEIPYIDIISSLDIGIEYQDSIDTFQYLINEIDCLLFIHEMKFLYQNYDIQLKNDQRNQEEDNIIQNMSIEVKEMFSKMKNNQKKAFLQKEIMNKNKLQSNLSPIIPPSENISNHNAIIETNNNNNNNNNNVDKLIENMIKETSMLDNSDLLINNNNNNNDNNNDDTDNNNLTSEKKRFVVKNPTLLKLPNLEIQTKKKLIEKLELLKKPMVGIALTSIPLMSYDMLYSLTSPYIDVNDMKSSLSSSNRDTKTIDNLLSILIETLLNFGKVLLLRCDCLRDGIRELEQRCNPRNHIISRLDIAQRSEDDIVDDIMDDVYSKFVDLLKAKQAAFDIERNKALNNSKKKSFMNISTDKDDSDEERNDTKKDNEFDENSIYLMKLKKLIPPINTNEIEIIDPIDSKIALTCIKYLDNHRLLTLIWCSQIFDMISNILKDQGWDQSYPKFKLHHRNVYNLKYQDWIVHIGGRISLLKAKLYKGLNIYSYAIHEYNYFMKINKAIQLRDPYIEIIKLHLAQGNPMLAKNVINYLITTFYKKQFASFLSNDDENNNSLIVMPEPIDVIIHDKTLALLYALTEEQLKQIESSQQIFSSSYNTLYGLQDNGLITGNKRIPIECQYGYTSNDMIIIKTNEEIKKKDIILNDIYQSRLEFKDMLNNAKAKFQALVDRNLNDFDNVV